MVTIPDNTVLPPRVVRKIRTGNSEEQRIYIQELIGSYEMKRSEFRSASAQAVERYRHGQIAHLTRCLEALKKMRESLN